MNDNNNAPELGIEFSEKTFPIIEQLANQMPGGFFIYHADGDETLIYMNNAMLEIFGCDTVEEFRELTNNSFKGIVHPDDLSAVENSINDQIASNRSNLDYVEYRIIRKDGTVRYVDDYGHFVHTEEYGDLYYVFINDATEKRMAEELERQQHLNKLKTDFLFNISHDIRTPMNAVMGFTALARNHVNDPDTVTRYLEKVDISNHHMMALIDDILEMSSLQSGNILSKVEKCSLNEVIKAALGVTEISVRDKGLVLKTNIMLPDETVYADRARLLRILSNLMTNAVKFTPDGGTVKFSACESDVSESGYARYEFRIEDTGIGISPEFMPKLFEPYEREESSTKMGYPGAGLGLSIVKSLTDIIGGTITAESVKNKGSVFTVSVPFRIAEHRERKETPAVQTEQPSFSGKRVLVVEDIGINRLLVETVMKQFGFEVESAADGCDAVDMVKDHEEGHYDLILMDIQMPVMSGYEAARAIRALGRKDTSEIPIIALSANASDTDKELSIESGMDTHIAAPFEIDNLVNTVKQYLR